MATPPGSATTADSATTLVWVGSYVNAKAGRASGRCQRRRNSRPMLARITSHASRKALTGLATAAAGAGGAAVKLGDEGLLAAGGGPAGEFFSCCLRELGN